MQVLYPRCAGLDVHKGMVMARVRCVSEPAHDEVRSCDTTTSALLELGDWLAEHGVTHVAMEATGVYWKLIWHLLEERFELILANAQHIKNVPGRKTDVNDAGWIADLLAHGLIRSSFVPPAPIQELRDLTRTRKQLVREISQHSLRIQKTLEDANLKLGSVLSDVLGKSGRAILAALVRAETDPQKLADLAQGNARKKRTELVEALRGRVRPHHQELLRIHLNLIDALHQALADVDARVGKTLAPIKDSARLLTTLPGVSELTAQVMVAEIGVDMGRFPTDAHLISWAGLCPRNEESAARRGCARAPRGSRPPSSPPPGRQCASRVPYLQAQFLRLKARRGAKKAILAVAASMLTAAYHMLKNGVEYQDLGADHFSRRDRSKAIQRLVRRLNDLGCEVQLAPLAA